MHAARPKIRRPGVRTSVRDLALTLAAVTLAAATPACGPAETGPRLVLFVSLDTLRRDTLGVYSDDAVDVTPRLDALARESVVFRGFGVQVPFTLPSHMSMFTGVYPGVHGVDSPEKVLSPRLQSLAESLDAGGWTTHGIVTNLWMKGDFGFARGFDSYERLPPGLTYAERIRSRALEHIDAALERDERLFLFLHYMDPHSDFDRVTGEALPYHAPEPWRRTVVDPDRFLLQDGRRATAFLEAANRGEVAIDAETADVLRRLYEDGVRHLDAELGTLLEALDERGVLDESLLVITSDHGEEFGEHGRFLHDQPYEECIAAPLIVRFPSARWGGLGVDALCESIDLMPTILEAVGLEPPAGIQGRSLLPILEQDHAGRPSILSRDKRGGGRYALRTERYKLVWNFAEERGELYDLELDPGEQRDLAPEQPARVEALRRQLEALARANDALGRHLAADPAEAGSVLSDDELRLLRSLGYFSDR